MRRLGLLLICITALCLAGCSKKANEPVLTISLEECDIVLNQMEAGKFLMGSYEGVGDEDELPVREVTITDDYYIGIYEITQKQWCAVMGTNPSGFQGEDLPVETVT